MQPLAADAIVMEEGVSKNVRVRIRLLEEVVVPNEKCVKMCTKAKEFSVPAEECDEECVKACAKADTKKSQTKVKGVGKGLGEKIDEFLQTGTMARITELEERSGAGA